MIKVSDIGRKLDYKIVLAEGDRIEIRLNDVSELDKTIPVGRSGTAYLYYHEDVTP